MKSLQKIIRKFIYIILQGEWKLACYSRLIWFYGISALVGFNAKSSLYIYIKYIWFGLVGFYGISTLVGYLMSYPLYTYYIYMICKWIVCRYHFKTSQSSFVCTQFNGLSFFIQYKWFYLILIICLHTVKWCQVLLFMIPHSFLVWFGFMAYQPL